MIVDDELPVTGDCCPHLVSAARSIAIMMPARASTAERFSIELPITQFISPHLAHSLTGWKQQAIRSPVQLLAQARHLSSN